MLKRVNGNSITVLNLSNIRISAWRIHMNVIITGAGFGNKGAQTMLFITVYEIKKRYPEYNVFFVSGERVDTESIKAYSFDIIYRAAFFDALRSLTGLPGLKRSFSDKVRNAIKIFVKYRIQKGAFSGYVRKIISDTVIFIDLSGFALSSAFKPRINKEYLTCIDSARLLGIPVVLMPQSFGPFNYDKKDMYLMEEMRELLKYPEVIYAREEEGYRYLLDNFRLSNLRHSSDIVLQNKGINRSNVCADSYVSDIPDIHKGNNVAIIPNYHCFIKGFEEHSFELYKTMIGMLTDSGKNVYVFRHASFDLDICKRIVDMFDGNDNVHLIEREFDCIEYDELIKKFDFIICSRYHGCVHAYKNQIPNIILGWAVKYRELASILGQEKYIFNIISKDCDDNKLFETVDRMINHYKDERDVISEKLKIIQKEDCFDIFDKIDW